VNAIFYIASAVAVLSTAMVVTRRVAVHALLYLVVSLLSVALVFFLLGAPFLAALEVILYAGAIMVLFVFVVMLLNLGKPAAAQETRLLEGRTWAGPALLAGLLLLEVVCVATGSVGPPQAVRSLGPERLGAALFGPYLLGVEIASFLLLAGLVGACHLGRSADGGGG
jgi:NADH-quinone oxidoreductase subunit J